MLLVRSWSVCTWKNSFKIPFIHHTTSNHICFTFVLDCWLYIVGWLVGRLVELRPAKNYLRKKQCARLSKMSIFSRLSVSHGIISRPKWMCFELNSWNFRRPWKSFDESSTEPSVEYNDSWSLISACLLLLLLYQSAQKFPVLSRARAWQVIARCISGVRQEGKKITIYQSLQPVGHFLPRVCVFVFTMSDTTRQVIVVYLTILKKRRFVVFFFFLVLC